MATENRIEETHREPHQKIPHKRVIVIGGGISGLSFAKKYLNANPDLFQELLLLEKEDRTGGVIETICHNDLIIELGTHTMYRSYTESYALLSADFRKNSYFPCPKFRYFVDAEGNKTPFWRRFSIFGLFSLPNILFMKREGQTLSAYFTGIFGKKNYQNLFNPAFDALYCQPSQDYPLSLLFKKRDRHKLRHLPKSFFFRGGMNAVVQDIGTQIDCRLNQKIQSVRYENGRYWLYTGENSTLPAYSSDILAIATEVTEAMRLLSGLNLQNLQNRLPDISMTRFSSLSLLLRGQKLSSDSGLVGWKNALFSVVFARGLPEDISEYHGLTCHYRDFDITEEKAINIASKLLKFDPQSIVSSHQKRNQLPAMRVRHLAEIQSVSEALPSTLALLGNYFGGFSIEDCIQRSGQEFQRIFG